MKAKFKLKRFICLVMALSICTCFSITAGASGNGEAGGNQTRAISGYASRTVNGYAEFTIYSPDWSLFAHATIMVSGAGPTNPVIVSIVDPKGKSVIPTSAQIFTSDYTIKQNFYNAPAGTYTVKVQTSGRATISVWLNDLYA